MWLYQRECSPTPATHESFCSTRPSASASPHTNLFNNGQVIGVCSPDFLGAGSGSLALIPAARLGWLLDGLRPGSVPPAGSG
jgi:hypothetical protein